MAMGGGRLSNENQTWTGRKNAASRGRCYRDTARRQNASVYAFKSARDVRAKPRTSEYNLLHGVVRESVQKRDPDRHASLAVQTPSRMMRGRLWFLFFHMHISDLFISLQDASSVCCPCPNMHVQRRL